MTRSGGHPGPADRMLSALLGLYPTEFRREYGRPIAQLIGDQWRDLGDVGLAEVVRFWLSVLVDIARSACAEHVSAWREREAGGERRPRRWLARLQLAFALALLAGSGANAVYDLAAPKLSMGAGAFLLTVVAAASGSALLLRLRFTRRRG